MDIKTLQRVIIDGLEDVKAQEIKVFDTTHLTSLFDRVVIASGTSNRQTRSLASSVSDKVRQAGGRIVSTEGGDTGEWVLVDCGDAIVHIMQPALRQYYNLEELWGGKAVKVTLGNTKRSIAGGDRGNNDESDDADGSEDDAPVINKARFAKPALAPVKASSVPSTTTLDDKPAKKTAARKAPAKKAAAKTAVKSATKTAVKRAAASADKSADRSADKPAVKRVAAKKTAARKTTTD